MLRFACGPAPPDRLTFEPAWAGTRLWDTPAPRPAGGSEITVKPARIRNVPLLGAVLIACAAALLAAVPASAAPHAPRIKVLSNRADLVSGGDALVRVTLPQGAKRLAAAADRRAAQRHRRAEARTGKRRLEGLVEGLRIGRIAAASRGSAAAAPHGSIVTNHPIGGPVFAGPQIQPWDCQETAQDAQCNQPPTFEFLYLPEGAPTQGGARARARAATTAGGPFQPYDPENPPSDGQHRDDDDDRGRHGPVHRPARDRLHRPRPVRDRDALRPEQAVDGDRAAAAVQPPPRDHPRLLLRHRVQDRRRAERARAEGPRRRLHRDVPRARPRRPQLQPAHPGRVAGDDQGARDRPLRHGPLDDRQRLLGRLAGPAAGGQRLSRRLPGDHAAVLVPRRVVVGDAVRGVLLRPAVPRGPDALGSRAWSTTRSRSARSSTTRTSPTRSRSPR